MWRILPGNLRTINYSLIPAQMGGVTSILAFVDSRSFLPLAKDPTLAWPLAGDLLPLGPGLCRTSAKRSSRKFRILLTVAVVLAGSLL
jgi:hypothetical protein